MTQDPDAPIRHGLPATDRTAARAIRPTRPIRPIRPWEFGALALLLAGALGVSLRLSRPNPYPTYDGAYYLQIASHLLHGRDVAVGAFPPGWPLLIALGARLRGPIDPDGLIAAAKGANALLALVSGLLAFLLIRRERTAWAALALTALVLFLPLHLQLACSDLSDLAFQCALLGALALVGRPRDFGAGLLLGFAYLVRPEAALAFLALAAATVRSRHRALARMVLGWCICFVPYVVYLSAHAGHLAVSAKLGMLEAAYEMHPGGAYAGLVLRNLAALVGFAVDRLGLALIALAAVGLAARRERWMLFLAPLLASPFFAFRMDARYLVPYVPFLGLAALYGWDAACVWLGRIAPRPRWRIVLGIALAASVAWAGVSHRSEARAPGEYYPAMRVAGLWLRERVTSTVIVAGRKPYVSLWAGCAFRRIPETDSLGGLLDWLEAEGASYLVVHVGEAAGLAPVLLPLVQGIPAEAHGRLSLLRVCQIPGQPNETTFIYRVERPPAGG